MSAGSAVESGVERNSAVEELQGLYGPFTFSEKLLQKIWFRGDFDRSRLTTLDGQRVSLLHAGKWNLLGGPDVKGARLRFDGGGELIGDVELHLRAGDWHSHAHASDPAYNRVVLHVVLFPPAPGHVTIGAGGSPIPVLVLLPLLHHDLEEYAADESVETLANRPAAHIVERLGPMPADELAALIQREALRRWQQKVHFARLRVARLGWDAACHQTAMEILGYRFNRSPMLRIATAIPVNQWSTPDFDFDAVFESERMGWSLQGLRPANHPRVRLRQYSEWVRAVPQWPARVVELVKRIPLMNATATTGELRRSHSFGKLRSEWCALVNGGALGEGTRWDTLLCDGLFPLLATRHDEADVKNLWYHWFCGDLPPLVPRALRQLEIFSGRARPACHGGAQGLLGWLLECERIATLPGSLAT